MKIIMRQDLAEEDWLIPANNNDLYYSSEQVARMEFVCCVDELGLPDVDGAFYAMRTDNGKLAHLYSIDLDFEMEVEMDTTTPEAYRETAQSYFKLPYDQRGDANGN